MPEGVIAAILAGGLGTRLRPLTLRMPKPLVRVSGRPFLHYLLSTVSSMGIRKCLLLTGYKGGMVRAFCGSGAKWGLSITYSSERQPLGTGGALYSARKKIRSTALVLNGDSWLGINLRDFHSFHKKSRGWATIFAMRGPLAQRGAIVTGRGGLVRKFLEKQKGGAGLFNTGAYLLEPSALDFLAGEVSAGRLPSKFSMERDGFPLLAARGRLRAYVGRGRFLDMGTFSSLLSAHKVLPGAQVGDAAVFLDRDGVINRHRRDYVRHPGEFEFEYGAMEGMGKLSKLGLPIIIVTNQSMVGRKIASGLQLKKIHAKMLGAFGRSGVKIKGVLVCPHSPQDGCGCRKPKIGMLLLAQEKHNIDLSKSFVVGDSTGDILMGKTAGCSTILLATGHGGKDALHKAKPDYRCKNLAAAAEKIAKVLAARAR